MAARAGFTGSTGERSGRRQQRGRTFCSRKQQPGLWAKAAAGLPGIPDHRFGTAEVCGLKAERLKAALVRAGGFLLGQLTAHGAGFFAAEGVGHRPAEIAVATEIHDHVCPSQHLRAFPLKQKAEQQQEQANRLATALSHASDGKFKKVQALAVVSCPMTSGVQSLTRARTSATWGTKAGSFRFPRWGTGAR